MSNHASEHARADLTPESFDRFVASLHPDREQAARQYEVLRRKLIAFFGWRGCVSSEEVADEVLDRMARKVAAGEQIREPSTYCYGIARLVYLEIRKSEQRNQSTLEAMSRRSTPAVSEGGADEARLECLGRCLNVLPEESRELIVGYYQMDKSAKIRFRKDLAERMRLPMNALRIRAHRLRDRLESCIQVCLDGRSE